MMRKIFSIGYKASFIIFFLFFYSSLFAQTLIFKGVVKDEQTLKPIPNVNIKVFGTIYGTATDKTGQFSIKLEKIPAVLVFTCVGYENEYYKITKISKNPIEFLLSSKAYTLKEVNITSKNYSFLFKDQDYSVLDYELMDENVLLLVFRTLLKQSQAILINRVGDTLAVSQLPEVPPSRFFKDFLSNIHYFSKSDNAYQCYYKKATNSIEFLYKTSVDSVEKLIKPFLFKIEERLYFQESIADKFGTALGYYQKGIGKKYIRQVINNKKVAEYIDDQKFYNRWNGGSDILDSNDIESDKAFDFSSSRTEDGLYGPNEARAHAFEYFNMIFPVVKTKDDRIVLFNFGEDVIELMNKNGKILNTIPISFHKETISKSDTVNLVRFSDSGWRWGHNILVDNLTNNVYTTYLKIGMIRINRIDLETGKLKIGTVIPIPFPEKIEIYDSEAYFLNKGINENWKLAKCAL